jgi:hypothetical protein
MLINWGWVTSVRNVRTDNRGGRDALDCWTLTELARNTLVGLVRLVRRLKIAGALKRCTHRCGWPKDVFLSRDGRQPLAKGPKRAAARTPARAIAIHGSSADAISVALVEPAQPAEPSAAWAYFAGDPGHQRRAPAAQQLGSGPH